MDWAAIASVTMAALALAGVAIGYGALRQKVSDMRARMDDQDSKIEKVTDALGSVADLRGEVRTFAAKTDGSHSLLLEKVQSMGELVAERLDGLRREMDGHRQPSSRRAPAKK